MKRQANEIIEGLTNEDANNLAAYLFDELPLHEQAANEIRAGRDLTSTPPPQPYPGCNWGSPLTNHDETVAEDDTTEAEALTDLPVEDAEQIKGGPSGLSAGKVSYSDLSVMY